MFEKTQTDYEAMAQALASDGGALAAELNVHCMKMYEASKVGAHDQRCSITEDSNPEGHNQYMGSSATKPVSAMFGERIQRINAVRASRGQQPLSEDEAKGTASYTDGLYKDMPRGSVTEEAQAVHAGAHDERLSVTEEVAS